MKQFITDEAKDPILGMDFDGTITYANIAACELLEYTEKQMSKVNFDMLLPDHAASTFIQMRESVLFNQSIDAVKIRLISRTGKSIEAVTQFSPIKDGEGKIIGISAFSRKVNTFEMVANNAQSLLETAPDAMVIINDVGQIVLINAQTERLFGYGRHELLGKDVETLIPDEFLKNHSNHRNKYIRQPKARNMGQGKELYGKKKDNSIFPVEISLSPMRSEAGVFVSAAIRDITDRKKAEKKFKGLLESAPDAMVIVGEGGIIQLVNAQVENIFGYTMDELAGMKVEILIPERFRNGHPHHRNGFFSSPNMRPMGAGLQLLGLRKNGEEFPVEISLSPLETEDGVLVSAAIRDITSRKKAEKELETYNNELKAKNKELEQFAYVASHDLQEPLRTVISFVQFLEADYMHSMDENGQKYLKFIGEATSRMGQLIKGLLDYSRIGRRRELVPIDCEQIMHDVEKDLEATISQTGARINVKGLPKMRAYETEMRLLFQNLTANAIKFIRPGTSPEVSVTAEKDKGMWRFAFKDNGIGIAEEHKERIFIIFQRLHTRSEYEGSGIGLAHCQKIAELHGGKIWVESKLDEGSTFYFTITEQ